MRMSAVQEWRANWRPGVAMFLALSVSTGAFASTNSLFIIPLQQAFGWSRGEIALANNATLVSAVCAPFLGRVVDRVGARQIMLGGMLGTALASFGMAAMNGSLALFYGLFVLINVLGLSFTGMTCSRVISEAFVASRGFSLAVARSGMALAGAMFPSLFYAIISSIGWRSGYFAQGLMILALAWPAVFFWVHRTRNGEAPPPRERQEDMPGWRALLSQRKVWLICLGAGLGYAPASALMGQMQPIIIGKGIAPASAAGLVGLAGAASFIGALVTGMLVDRFWAPAIAFLFALGSMSGCILLASGPILGVETVALAVGLIGLGLGAEIDVAAYVVARYFGVRNFSTLYGMVAFSLSVSGAMGHSFLGLTYDRFGSYDFALLVLGGGFVLAGLMYLLLGSYPPLLTSNKKSTD